MNVARLAWGSLLAGVVGSLAAACVDLSPVDFTPPEAGPMDARSVVVDAADRDAFIAGCQECLSTKCGSYLAACNADPACGLFAACMTDQLCWASALTDLAHLQPCVVTCAEDAGIVSQNSPSAALVSALYTCAQDPAQCGATCLATADLATADH